MLSNQNKLRLAEKFKFMKVKEQQALPQNLTLDTDTETETETETDEDTDEEKAMGDESPAPTKNTYIHAADTLPKELPPKKYTTIHVCTYQVNTQHLYPFLLFLLYKDATNVLGLPDLSGYTGADLIKYVLAEFSDIFADVVHAELEYKGFIEQPEADGIILVLEYKANALKQDNQRLIEKGEYTNNWWWVLAAEIINNKEVLNFPIQPFTVDVLVKHHTLGLLYNAAGKPYETPEIGYYGNYYKKIAAVASLGLSRESPYASFGPFYYFSNYTHAMRNAFWNIQRKPVKIGEEYITEDDKGRYKKGGLVRFALFPGQTQMLLGRPTDKADDSQISQELAMKSPFVKAMLKLRDTGAKWIAHYNSIRIGQHQIDTTDSAKPITTNPLIALREYEQQVPLEYYFVDTSQAVTEENIQKAVIL